MILETIVTTLDADGSVNSAPMGVEWGEEIIVLKPFIETTTYRNVRNTGVAVVNLVDDVRLIARAAVSSPRYETIPARAIRGAVLAGCCSWRELQVRTIDDTPPRSRIETTVVHRGVQAEFIGFNRAAAAVIEAAIYATRLHLLAPSLVTSELDRLQVIVDKTAGPREREAMALLVEHIHGVLAGRS